MPDSPTAIDPPIDLRGLSDASRELIDTVFSSAAAFEREWAPQVGGDAAEPMRMIMGMTLGALVQRYNVDPCVLADYVRETIRFTYPEAFK